MLGILTIRERTIALFVLGVLDVIRGFTHSDRGLAIHPAGLQ